MRTANRRKCENFLILRGSIAGKSKQKNVDEGSGKCKKVEEKSENSVPKIDM